MRGVWAGVVAGVVSGVPSTVHALVTGRDVLAAVRAAGKVVLPREERDLPLILVAVPVHLGISVWWGTVLARVLPRGGVVAGGIAGAVIALLDLRLPGRRVAAVRALPVGPQVADHVVFGAVVGACLRGTGSQVALSRVR
jgi:hypothetical protein